MATRFITIESYDGLVRAFTEGENYALELDAAACWVWQWADSREHAISQHYEKHAAWEHDANNDNPILSTY